MGFFNVLKAIFNTPYTEPPPLLQPDDIKPGDEWVTQAYSMLNKPLIQMEMTGCMAHIKEVKNEGYCAKIRRVPDGGAPDSRIIWLADGVTAKGNTFQCIVARCFWDDNLKSYIEHY